VRQLAQVVCGGGGDDVAGGVQQAVAEPLRFGRGEVAVERGDLAAWATAVVDLLDTPLSTSWLSNSRGGS
jgi:hypothetical protein